MGKFQTSRAKKLAAGAAVLSAIAAGGCSLGQTCAAPGPLAKARCHVEGRLAAMLAAGHSEYDPVVAPHPRFHPVPTRPVFAPPEPPPVELLAEELPPPKPLDGQGDESPAEPPAEQEPVAEAPDKLAMPNEGRPLAPASPSDGPPEMIPETVPETADADPAPTAEAVQTVFVEKSRQTPRKPLNWRSRETVSRVSPASLGDPAPVPAP